MCLCLSTYCFIRHTTKLKRVSEPCSWPALKPDTQVKPASDHETHRARTDIIFLSLFWVFSVLETFALAACRLKPFANCMVMISVMVVIIVAIFLICVLPVCQASCYSLGSFHLLVILSGGCDYGCCPWKMKRRLGDLASHGWDGQPCALSLPAAFLLGPWLGIGIGSSVFMLAFKG